jgi:hypothetical protein
MNGVEANSVHPRGEARAAAKGREPEPGADERLLDGVGSVVPRAEETGGESEKAVLVPVDQLLERPAVALLRARYERSVRIIHA